MQPTNLLAVIAIILLSVACVHAAPLVLVRDGQPNAGLVYQKDSEKSRRAAEALRQTVRRMSGAELPMAEDGTDLDPTPKVIVHVGVTEKVKSLGIDVPSGFDPTVGRDAFEEEGFVLRTAGDTLVVAGNNDGPYRGTLYAAYELLRRLGCRWFFPGEWGEVIPRRNTIQVPELDVRERPDFAVRRINISGWVPISREERAIYEDWCVKVGMSARKGFYPVAGDGFLAFLVPPQEYFEEHPEWYAQNEAGDRHAHKLKSGHYYARHTMLCLSNEEMFEESVKNLRLAFAGEKKLRNVTETGFGISPPDGTPYCYCEECKAASQNFHYPRYVHRTCQSEEFFSFAARLARKFPGKFCATMAYSLREIVPQGVSIPQNMSVTIAPISCDVLHPNDTHLWRRRDFVRNLKAWREKTPHIMIYDYTSGFLTGCWVPERDVANMAVNVPMYRDIDIKGMRREGRKAFMQTWLSYYATARLLWDADTDVEALKDDFYTTFFGPEAGPHVRAWWDACEAALVGDDVQAHEDFLVNHIYRVDFTQGIAHHVEAARKAEGDPAQRRRVEAFALIAEHLEAYARMNDAESRLDYASAAEAAGRMVELENRLHEIYPFFIENGKRQQRSYFPAGRRKIFEDLDAKTNGERGELVAALPVNMKFRRDPFNEGIVGRWDEPDHDTADWGTENTFYTWDQQDEPLDDAGHHYDGYGWYRGSVEVPARYEGREMRFWSGGAINEAWVWINGLYAGHKPHKIWWSRPQFFELDVTDQIRPGQKNVIAIRVLNDADIGGLYRRAFIWSPHAESQASDAQ